MLIVSFSVDSEAANTERCFTDSLVQAAEQYDVPLTWLIFVSRQRPMDNARLYQQEYFHRIPSWHEIGLHVHFEDNGPPNTDVTERCRLIRLGKEVLKQVHVKPTSFRAGCYQLMASDTACLEEIGILVDSSAVPNASRENLPQWEGAPTKPYRPAYENLAQEGDADMVEIPVATHEGAIAYLDGGFEKMKPVLENAVANSKYISIGCHDYADCAETLRASIEFLTQHDARFVTLTQMYALWKSER